MSAKTYRDVNKCPAKHRIVTIRRVGTAGRIVRTYCMSCRRAYQIKAGPLPVDKAAAQGEQAAEKGGAAPALTTCAAGRDGECGHAQCPQLRDSEPNATGRHCPLDNDSQD